LAEKISKADEVGGKAAAQGLMTIDRILLTYNTDKRKTWEWNKILWKFIEISVY